jgi:hypothetical protein
MLGGRFNCRMNAIVITIIVFIIIVRLDQR